MSDTTNPERLARPSRATPTRPTPTGPPRHDVLPEMAEYLLRRTSALVAALDHGEAGLIGKRICVVSADGMDVFVARLLSAHGAHVVFLGPRSALTDAGWRSALIAYLAHALRGQRPDLALSTLLPDEEPSPHLFQIETRSLAEYAAAQPQGFPLVVGLGLLPDDGPAARQVVELLARLTIIGGDLEIFDRWDTPLSPATADWLEKQTPDMCLGIRVHQVADAARGTFVGWRWHLGVVRLSEPLYESPDETVVNTAVLAHCRARLDFAAEYAAGCDILEAGCAAGIGARLFRAKGARSVVGLDISDDILNRARQQTSDPCISYRRWNLNETPLPLPDASFDLIVCTEVLEHITAHEAILAEFHRLLRPGGRLIISVPDRQYEELWTRLNRFGNPFHVRTPRPAEFARLLGGFAQVRWARQFEAIGSTVVYDDEELFAGEFVAEHKEARRQTMSVRLAVCFKAPVEKAVVRRTTRMRVYDNFSEIQVGWHQHRAGREAHNLVERQRAWQSLNLGRIDPSAADVAPPIQLWYRSGGLAVSVEPLEAGDWMNVLAIHLDGLAALHGVPQYGLQSPCWLLEIKQGLPRLVPLNVAPPVHSVLFPVTEQFVGVGLLWYWRRRGACEFWFRHDDGWRRLDAEAFYARRFYRRGLRRLLGWLVPNLRIDHDRAEALAMRWAMRRRGRWGVPEMRYGRGNLSPTAVCTDFVSADNAELRRDAGAVTGRPLRIVQYIGALYSGGAERQLCNLAVGLKRRKQHVQVLTTHELAGNQSHYANFLRKEGIPARRAVGQALLDDRRYHPWELGSVAPAELREPVYRLASELIDNCPDVLHCWLDAPNIIGGIAGLIAGVPRILLSLRNVNPTHFPRLLRPYLQEWYRLLAGSDRVHFLANSRGVAASYAEWIGIAEERIHIVVNGLFQDHFPPPTQKHRAAARKLFGLNADQPVIVGVFRLDQEKQPDLFLETVRRVAGEVPDLRVLLAGTGPLADEMKTYLHKNGMSSYVHLLGRRADIENVYLAGDLLLLTSTNEGCPNVALEAQHLGLPVVATHVGGTADAVVDGGTGLLAPDRDAAGLADAAARILREPGLRQRMSDAARDYAARRFDLDTMIDLTRAVYDTMFAPPGSRPRVVTPNPVWETQRLAG